MIRLRDWIADHFDFNFNSCNTFDLLYFRHRGSVPQNVYNFNTRKQWSEIKEVFLIFCSRKKIKEPSIYTNQIVTLPQLLEQNLMKTIYYHFGYDFCLFIFLECTVFLKWGSNTFIILSDFKNKLSPNPQPKATYFQFYKKVLITQGNGYDKNIPLEMHRMFYNINVTKNSSYLLTLKTSDELWSCILKTYVGQNIYSDNDFKIKKIKALNALLFNNPKKKDCQVILSTIIKENENIVPVDKVICFLLEVLKKYVPHNIFGYKKSFNKFLRNIQQLFKFSKKQNVTLGFLLKGVIIKAEMWKKNLLAKIVLWLFNEFVIKLIKLFFYTTEVEKDNSLVFIKKHFWLKYMKETVKVMVSNYQLEELPFLPSKGQVKPLRFLPKLSGSGYRPVIKKSAVDKILKEEYELSNIFLKQLIAVRCGRYPQQITELHKSWINFIKKRSRNKCFYVKTDVKDAYGSVIHEKLKSILEKWCEGLPSNLELLNFTYEGKWGKVDTLSQYVNLQPSVGNKILKYKPGGEKIVQLEKIKTTILNYIDNIFISCTTRSKIYKLRKGLHQGGKLSAALCEIYYSALDQEYLKSLCNHAEGDILLRTVDDYIFVSQNVKSISCFLETMSKGFPDYGVEIQLEKTMSNIEHQFLSTIIEMKTPIVPYFGYLLDVDKGFITPNMEKYKGINIKSSICFKNLNKSVLESKMTYIISLKLQKLALDPAYQTKKILFNNIHIASCVLALKFVAMTHFLRMAEVDLDDDFMVYCIRKGITAVAQSCFRKGKPAIKVAAAKRMCLKSFIQILKRKQCFSNIIYALQEMEKKIHIPSKRIAKVIKFTSKTIHSSLLTSVNLI